MSQPPSPQRFRPYTDDQTSPDAKTRRIDSPAAGDQDDPWQQMVNPDWRAPRRRPTTRPSLGAGKVRMPDPQRIGNWMNQGGAKIIAGVAAGVVVLFLIVLLINRPGGGAEATPTPSVNLGLGGQTDVPGGPIIQGTPPPTADPNLPPTADPNQQPAPGNRVVVTNTGVEGLFMREQPSVGATILETLPEGSQVEKIGEQEAEGRVWFNIRNPATGQTGYGAADFLVPAP
ncbi:MAG TPA: SH3 domain-containing protein [Herpetosiphonaceae bacterium]